MGNAADRGRGPAHFTVPEIVPNPTYDKGRFIIKLQEMGLESSHGAAVMDSLADRFTLQELEESVRRVTGKMLMGMGFDVVTENDGVEGLEAYRTCSESICTVQ